MIIINKKIHHRYSIENIFDNIRFMDSPLFHKLQNFDCTASSQHTPGHYLPSPTNSQIFMSHKYSTSSARLSFSQQKSSLRTQPLTQSQRTSSSQIVQNICNQIKYLIEGNLKSSNTDCNTTDFVRQNVIPMLIKMFFQTPKTDFSMGDSFGNPKEQLKDITNNFGIERPWKTNDFMKEAQSHQEFGETFKSELIQKTRMEQKQNFANEENTSEKKFQVVNSEPMNSQIKLPETLCLSILLYKTLVVRKSSSFQRIKVFGQMKYKKIEKFISLVRKIQIQRTVKKFQANRTQKLKEAQETEIKIQSRRFNQKRMSLSCQVVEKIIRMRLKGFFKLFKENCFTQNKFMRQWVRYAALRSPLTVKTSIWRLKQFMAVEDPQKYPPLENYVQKNQKTEKEIQIADQKDQPKTLRRKVTEPDVSQIDSQSQQGQSISSDEFQKMFESQIDQQVAKQSFQRPSLDFMVPKNKNKLFEEPMEEQQKEFEDDEYLRTISEDQQENQYLNE